MGLSCVGSLANAGRDPGKGLVTISLGTDYLGSAKIGEWLLIAPAPEKVGGSVCFARAIVSDPEVLLLDEPCSALDPIATQRVEELIGEISERYSVLIVTHNMQQAARVSQYTAFMYLGNLVEFGPTQSIFQQPALAETEQYVTGRFG